VSPPHFLTVGAPQLLVESLWQRIAEAGGLRFSHLVHPALTADSWSGPPPGENVHFLNDHVNPPMPAADHALLASLEREGVPTIHNMILGDRILARLPYEEALGYATYLARQMIRKIESIRPSVIIGAFDALHGGLSLAIARRLGIPWFALHFSVIPTGYACFCNRMTPAARVMLEGADPQAMARVAEQSLAQFEARSIRAPAYIAPAPAPLLGKLASIPRRTRALRRTLGKRSRRQFLRFVEEPSAYDVGAVWKLYRRSFAARHALLQVPTLNEPPRTPFALFALHMQPESSIDVWAPYCANQMAVIEALSRSLPPTHKLLVKIHKSDVANYSLEQLQKIRSLPGVEIVAPFADSRQFLERMDLLFSIQGTVGLEASLLGKPVIVLADSPVTIFPNADPVGAMAELPSLVKRKLGAKPPSRAAILEAYTKFLTPFLRAGHNNWLKRPDDEQIAHYVRLFEALARTLARQPAASHQNGAGDSAAVSAAC
jgi:hypothetical protein